MRKSIKINTDVIFEPGFFGYLYSNLQSGNTLVSKEKLSVDQLARVPEIYAMLSTMDINILENNKDYDLPSGGTIKGADVKAITLVMYEYARSKYVNSLTQVRNSALSAAVPIPLLGRKRFRNETYESHRTKSMGDIDGKLDILLGYGLRSTRYNAESGTLEPIKPYGLQRVPEYTKPDLATISHIGGDEMSFRTIKISPAVGVDNEFIAMYNNCTGFIRLMLTQRWVWHPSARCTDMICDPMDWDHTPNNKATDLSMMQKRNTSTNNLFGLDTTSLVSLP